MADRSAADDFFGIEYMSSQSRAEEPKDEKVRPSPDSISARSPQSVNLEDVPEKDLGQLSGTEFLDRAFFPQLQHDQVPSEISRSEPEPDFFEKEFFGRIGTADKIEATSPLVGPVPRRKTNECRRPLRDALEEGTEDDRRRMDSRRIPFEDRNELVNYVCFH
ncbi:unnamed protein product [Nippostrongylus brasiliensis]|uniref:Clathrin light chain n=1 Tax=Nippostrongylus brasiliensis TaxID=27835 RepID=A0A0N4YEN8_NIPBR|nr:unnamed protein product [Nippostrongylus brasiliensis]